MSGPVPADTGDEAWRVVFEHYDADDETRRESLLGLGNGLFFLRGCAPEAVVGAQRDGAADPRHYPGLYVAGFYDESPREVNGETARIASLARLPHPLALGLHAGGDDAAFAIDGVELLHYRQVLEMRDGLSRRELVWRDAAGRETRIDEERLASLAQPGLALLRWRVRPLNWTGPLRVRAWLPLQGGNAKVGRSRAYEGRRVDVRPLPVPEGQAVLASTADGRRALRIAVRLRVDGEPAGHRGEEPQALWQECRREARRGEELQLELHALVSRQEDGAPPDPPAWEQAAAAQREAWGGLWSRVHAEAPGDPELERICRFNAFHLLQTASPLTPALDVGLPARGWQEAYFGHVFWDELLAFPFLSPRRPDIARGLLCYRHRRLGAARAAARQAGLRGAMYPWRSAASGAEETPPWQFIPPSGRWKRDHTRLQRHIGAAVAYNLWHHHLATDDRALLLGTTGEMLVEIARFWASIAAPHECGGRYEIRGVIGPDEYHDAYPGASRPGLDNNAYTNAMAAWTLRCASALPRRLDAGDWRRLKEATGLRDAELAQWDEISRRLKLPLHEGGLIEQFDGYERLRPVDAEPLPRRDPGMREDWWLDAQGESVNAYQVTKQADVLMLCHLLGREDCEALVAHLGYRLARGWYERTVRHHLAHVSHESSLSRVVCAGALASVDPELSWHYFRQALHTDLGTGASGSTHEGLHLGAMAGTWDVLQRHYLGLHLEADGVWLDPRPPAALEEFATTVWIRGHRLRLHLRGTTLRASVEEGDATGLRMRHRGAACVLRPGEVLEIACR
ncbi:glycoside hydrolase family 65 protein [Caldimonas tepidiphila]|uniref:glycoside hydrolase family 65 protein n=1 Tax=Caldimonas tepidiphila TaxID=2315841 RepID=UPI001474F827|nr:glycoside hydrolase family 65 protein [Caldimonas tepidiphila]